MAKQRSLPQPTAEELVEGQDAIAEAAAVASGLDLSDRTELNKINKLLRRDKMDGHLHRLLVIGLYVFGVSIALMFVSLVCNMAAPQAYRFLDADEITSLQQFLFSGALGSAMTAAAKKVAGKSDDDE